MSSIKNERILHLTQAVPDSVIKMAECKNQHNLTHCVKCITAFITKVKYATEVRVTNQRLGFHGGEHSYLVELRHHVVWQEVKDVSEEHASCILTSVLKIEKACVSVKMVTSYQTTLYHKPEVHSIN
jgi:hypothetical protein